MSDTMTKEHRVSFFELGTVVVKQSFLVKISAFVFMSIKHVSVQVRE